METIIILSIIIIIIMTLINDHWSLLEAHWVIMKISWGATEWWSNVTISILAITVISEATSFLYIEKVNLVLGIKSVAFSRGSFHPQNENLDLLIMILQWPSLLHSFIIISIMVMVIVITIWWKDGVGGGGTASQSICSVLAQDHTLFPHFPIFCIKL